MERMIRRWKSLSKEEVQHLFDTSSPEIYAHGGLGEGPYRPPYCDKLNGRTFILHFENDTFTIRITGTHSLEWSCSDEPDITHSEYHQCLEAEEGIYFLQFAVRPSVPPRVMTLVLDCNNGLVTMVRAHLGNESEAREMSRTFHFGTIEGYESYPEEKHHFTKDLVGKAIYWTYIEGMAPLKHIYSTEYFYTYVMNSHGKCWVASNPADYIKINDHLYIFTFVEERQAGVQGMFLINTETLHDVGSFAGINGTDQFECYVVGAKGEWTTMDTILGE